MIATSNYLGVAFLDIGCLQKNDIDWLKNSDNVYFKREHEGGKIISLSSLYKLLLAKLLGAAPPASPPAQP